MSAFWLKKQIDNAAAEMEKWPDWMQKDEYSYYKIEAERNKKIDEAQEEDEIDAVVLEEEQEKEN